MADLLAGNNKGKIPTGNKVKVLDIGVGANCVYPVVGNKEYGWSFVGTETNPVAIASAKKIIEMNPSLKGEVDIRLQKNPKDIFQGIIQKGERFDLTICNPPFHSSAEEARSGTLRKLSNLKHKKVSKATLNFGGQNNELWCEGGEKRFILEMILQSKQFSASCSWFSTLVAKQANLESIYYELKKAEASEVKTIPMGQGNKTSRIVAWTFFKKQ
jgi:23S rRNA (adenine1618-N6)-methyltransferase